MITRGGLRGDCGRVGAIATQRELLDGKLLTASERRAPGLLIEDRWIVARRIRHGSDIGVGIGGGESLAGLRCCRLDSLGFVEDDEHVFAQIEQRGRRAQRNGDRRRFAVRTGLGGGKFCQRGKRYAAQWSP